MYLCAMQSGIGKTRFNFYSPISNHTNLLSIMPLVSVRVCCHFRCLGIAAFSTDHYD